MSWRAKPVWVKGVIIGLLLVLVNIISLGLIGLIFYELSNLLYSLILFGPICSGPACLLAPFFVGSIWLFVFGFLVSWKAYKSPDKLKGALIGILYFLVIFTVIMGLIIAPIAISSYAIDKTVIKKPKETMLMFNEQIKKVSTYSLGEGELIRPTYIYRVDGEKDTIHTYFNTRYNIYKDQKLEPISFYVETTPLKPQKIYNRGVSRGTFNNLLLDYKGVYDLEYTQPTEFYECVYIQNNGSKNGLPLISIALTKC